MTVKGIVTTLAAAGLVGVALSCRRETVKPAAGEPSSSSDSKVTARSTPMVSDTNLLAAVADRHRAERELRANDPQAEALFVRLTETETAYSGTLLKFGAYALPAAERDAAMTRLAAALEAGDSTAAQAAEKTMREADERAEAAAASLRSGHPPIQKAYDDWMEARRAYADRVKQSETVSKAEARLSAAMEPTLEHDVNDRAKEK